jgi:ADP-dependent NAD(P)H-hydrate dehydratase / NAD(P)H-hydrate epimerase
MRLAAEEMSKIIIKLALINGWRSFIIFVGSGNNGGDGYVIGEFLLKQGFMSVALVPVMPLKPNICANEARNDYLKNGGCETCYDEYQHYDCVIDAITGIGLTSINSKNINEYNLICNFVEIINKINACVISVDIPSLLSANNGLPIGEYAVKADYTLTVFSLKPGCLLGYAKDYCGKVFVVLNNLENFEEISKNTENNGVQIRNIDYLSMKPFLPKRLKCVHKGDVGKILLVGGNNGMAGALIITSLGALRSGAGLICSFPIAGETTSFNYCAPEIMLTDLDNLPYRLSWSDTCVFGPGLGKTDKNQELFDSIYCYCSKNGKKLVIDADGLYYLKNSKVNFIESELVLTPHLGEAAMLCDATINEVMHDPMKFAFDIAHKYHAICVLKSATTLVCDSDKHYYIASVGSPGMASGGMGDLLSGIIGSLLSQGNDALKSALLAVVIHGHAGEMEEEKYGAIGMCATDLLDDIRLSLNGKTNG